MIEEVDLIVDLKRYVEHWRQRFAKQSIAEIFPKVVPKEGDDLFGKVDYFFEMVLTCLNCFNDLAVFLVRTHSRRLFSSSTSSYASFGRGAGLSTKGT